METSYRSDDDDEGGAPGSKLIPEWSVAADDQVVFAGLAVVAVLAALFGWNAWRGGDGDVPEPLAPVVEAVGENAAADDLGPDSDGSGSGDGQAASVITTTEAQATTSSTTSSTTSTDEAPSTTQAAAESTITSTAAATTDGNVQAAVDAFPGDIAGSADGTIAVLNGFVANDAESREAATAAAAVEGITSVENNLVLLEPAVGRALQDAGVTGATAIGRGTEISVSGTIDTEDDRQPALDAAAGVPGVSEVFDDRLNLSVTADLNALPQVQFATASAEILPVSFGDLDDAAQLMADAGDISIEVQGYTDVVGPADGNLRLSRNRAEAVRSYLVDAGVDPDILSAAGFGETDEFGIDLASNRVVRFQQIDG